MPYFDENPLDKLAAQPREPDAVLDLCGMTGDAALQRVADLLAGTLPVAGRHVHIRFDPPRGDGRETLFLPLGRYLLAARKAGRLAACLPAASGNGYHIVLPGDGEETP